MDVRFRVLGPVDLVVGGEAVAVRSGRQRTVLAVLLVQLGRRVSVDQLVDALWPDSPPAQARGTLHAHVSRLRALLDHNGVPGCLLTSAGGYLLDADGAQVDAPVFERLTAEARTLLPADPAGSLARLDEADGLWRGPAYGDEADRDPVRAEAARLDELRLDARDDRVDAALALGRHTEVIADRERAVKRHPLRERPYGQLMLARHRAGRTAEALRAYRDLRRTLADELGMEPSPALRRIESEILRSPPEVAPPAPSPGDTADESPVALTSFVGRAEAVAGLSALLRRARLVTLTGTGGAGKTRLAREVAGRVADRFPDGVGGVELAPVRDARAVATAFASELRVVRQGAVPLVDTLVAALRPRRMLLVVDNCEHVLAQVGPLLERLTAGCPRLVVLATSRERLAVPGEHCWPVVPLAVPTEGHDDPGAVGRVPSVQLFRDRAVAADPAFRLDERTTPAVAVVCRRLDGLPLAIELAAARSAAVRPADLAARLHARFGMLTGGPREPTGRHRTLRATVDWSYALLTGEEAALFDRLSVFPGGFDLDAAEGVAEACAGGAPGRTDVAGLLAALVEKSMVVAESSGPTTRYRLLETLRDYGGECLAARSGTRVAARAHSEYFVRFAERSADLLRGREEARAVAALDREVHNLRAAHRWAVGAGDADLALRLSAALHFHAIHRLGDEMLGWAAVAAELPTASGHPLQASAYASAAFGAVHRGERDLAHRLAERGHAVATGGAGLADVLETMAATAIYEGRLADSRRHGLAAAEVARAAGDRYRTQWSTHVAAVAATYAGDADAPQLVDAVVAGAAALDNPTQSAWARYLQGEAVLERDPDRAVPLLEEAVALATPVRSDFVRGVALVSACSARGRSTDPWAAIVPFREAISHWSRAGDWTHQWTTLRNLLDVLVRVGADDTAAVLHAASEGASSAPPVFGVGAERLARAGAVVRGRLGPARFADAVARAHRMDDDEIVALVLEELTDLAAGGR